MPLDLSHLNSALAERYRIERELGRGGMAVVFLAEDLKHHRPVAVKVLKPELAAALGPERFLREIEISARLHHPHILPLYDSGQAENLLYYIMPHVEGESLRDRLTREKQLSLDDALQIAGEVADALSYAHSHGVVHRDVKPENILLESGHAVVGDFGIARAITAAGGEKLTATGLAIGTPAYMSPEQAGGDHDVDGRSDLYSLACVVYEMLAGQPPFTGPTTESLIHQHLAAEPPRITAVRSAVPETIEAALQRAMAKTPADRFGAAVAFADALRLPLTTDAQRAARRSRRRVATGAAVIALAAAGVWLGTKLTGGFVAGSEPAGSLDPDVVTVLPFRVSGADPSLNYLREGMVDLLAAKLSGEVGTRAVDPRTALAAWRAAGGTAEIDPPRDAALEAARRLGSGRVLLGEIVGTADRILISATLEPVESGRTERASLEGPADSLLSLVDRLAVRLLALGVDEDHRLEAAISTSLPALRAYLDGQAAYRLGRYDDAFSHFDRARGLDSTFAMAAMGLAFAAQWASDVALFTPARATVWTLRERLAPRDRAVLEAWLGPNYPGLSTLREILAAHERAVLAAPDHAEAWYNYGDHVFHYGRPLGIDDWRESARRSFRRVVGLDSTFSAALQHLVDVSAAVGDSDQTRHWARLFLAGEAAADLADYVRWRLAASTGDASTLRELSEQFELLSPENQRRILGWMQIEALALEDAPRLARAHRRTVPDVRIANWAEFDASARSLWLHRAYLLNSGRPKAAATLLRSQDVRFTAAAHLAAAIWGGGDNDDARPAAAVVRDAAYGPVPADSLQRTVLAEHACLVARWDLEVGDVAEAARAVQRGQTLLPSAERQIPTPAVLCWETVEAMLARAEDRTDWRSAVYRLDSLSLTGGVFSVESVLTGATPLIDIARLLEAAGDLAAARRAIARRPYHHDVTIYLSQYLRETGRLAAIAGDTAAAITAFEHYLALRPEPEPAVVPEVERIRGELARLSGGKRQQ